MPVFGEEKLHNFPESNNDLTMAAEGTSEKSCHIGLSKALIPKL
jgi:hypothetical protein